MIKINKFKPIEKEELTNIMTRAFDYDSKIHLGTTGGPDGYNDGSFIDKWFMHKNATPLTIFYDDKIIGGLNLWINNDTNINFLGSFFIDPSYEDKGIGTKVWKIIENMFPNSIEWRTETPGFSHRNHHFYVNKCGFHVIKIENPKDQNESSFILSKKM